MRIDVFTIFPEVIDRYGDASILGRARKGGRLDLRAHDIRSASTDPHHGVDDAPFGGWGRDGPGSATGIRSGGSGGSV